jgi:hypothetical protein
MKAWKKRFSAEYQQIRNWRRVEGETYRMVNNLWRWAPWGNCPCPCRRVGSPEWRHSSSLNCRSRHCVPPGRTSPTGGPLTAEETPAPPAQEWRKQQSLCSWFTERRASSGRRSGERQRIWKETVVVNRDTIREFAWSYWRKPLKCQPG